MPGLLNDPNAIDPRAGDQMPASAPTGSDTVSDEEGGEQATPEEQAKYEEFVKTGYELMYSGGKVNPAILKMLDDDPSDLVSVLGDAEEMQKFSPVVALAATATIITLKACEKTGEKDGTIILHGGKAILEDLVEIAGKAGVRDYSEDDMANAMRMGADLFREAGAKAGIVNLDEAKGEWDEITAADREGRLGEVVPQLAGAAAQEQQQGQQQPPPQETADGQP